MRDQWSRKHEFFFPTLFFALFLCVCESLITTSSPSAKSAPLPQLILISGCTGTGKSTFGMEVAINQGILKCISTDTIRQVMRSSCERFDFCEVALQRSSFQGDDDPVVNWLEACKAVESGIEAIIDDSIHRGVSLVLEGVHIVPCTRLLERWTERGGLAIGIVLTIPDADVHRRVITRRGEITKKGAGRQTKEMKRIRAIHDEMVNLGKRNQWLLIEQKPRLEPQPIDMVADLIQSRYMEGYFDRLL